MKIAPLLTNERNRQEHDHVWANLPTLSLAGIGETNETRETHETQNIRLVFWGLQRKHEEYRQVGVGLALPLTLFQVGSASVGGAYMPFCGMCATSGYRMPACLELLIAHIAKDAMYAPPLIFGSSPGWRIHAVLWHVCDLRL